MRQVCASLLPKECFLLRKGWEALVGLLDKGWKRRAKGVAVWKVASSFLVVWPPVSPPPHPLAPQNLFLLCHVLPSLCTGVLALP